MSAAAMRFPAEVRPMAAADFGHLPLWRRVEGLGDTSFGGPRVAWASGFGAEFRLVVSGRAVLPILV